MNPPVETDTEHSQPLPRWKRQPWSLKIFLIHSALVAVSVLMLLSPLSHKPGPIHPLLVIPFFLLLFSPLVYLVTLVLGMRDLWEGSRRVVGGIVTCGSALALVGVYRVVAYYWNAMLYI